MIPSFEHRHSLGGRACPMGGGGGASTSTNRTENKDSRISLQSGTATSGDGNTINVLDGGAIKNAFDFAQASQAASVSALTTTSKLVSDAYLEAKGRGAMTDYIIIGAVALTGLVAVMALRK